MSEHTIDRAIDFVVRAGRASVEQLRRALHVRYSEAARLVDEMEWLGVVGPWRGSRPRKVLWTISDWREVLAG
jgi:S-DNA-T family DNA segregation ATPase FtsK/SpoIIIE